MSAYVPFLPRALFNSHLPVDVRKVVSIFSHTAPVAVFPLREEIKIKYSGVGDLSCFLVLNVSCVLQYIFCPLSRVKDEKAECKFYRITVYSITESLSPLSRRFPFHPLVRYQLLLL